MTKKHLAIPLGLAILAFFIFESCYKQEPTLTEKVELDNQKQALDIDQDASNIQFSRTRVPDNTISVATFHTWNESWRTHWDAIYIKHFTMSLSNLQNLLNTPDVKAARFYLGYSEADATPHLSLVGVNAANESMIGANDYIYNVSKPCPTLCEQETPAGTVFPSSGLTSQPPNTISLATFHAWNTSWESHWNDKYIQDFTMALSNLQNLVNTNGVSKVRFYLGYSEAENMPHMTMVGVDANGYSMIGANTHIYNRTHMSPPRQHYPQ